MGNLFAVLIRMGDGVYANLEYRYNKRRLDGNGKVMVRLEIVFYCVHILLRHEFWSRAKFGTKCLWEVWPEQPYRTRICHIY